MFWSLMLSCLNSVKEIAEIRCQERNFGYNFAERNEIQQYCNIFSDNGVLGLTDLMCAGRRAQQHSFQPRQERRFETKRMYIDCMTSVHYAEVQQACTCENAAATHEEHCWNLSHLKKSDEDRSFDILDAG